MTNLKMQEYLTLKLFVRTCYKGLSRKGQEDIVSDKTLKDLLFSMKTLKVLGTPTKPVRLYGARCILNG